MNARDELTMHYGTLSEHWNGLLDQYRAEVLSEAKAEVVAWLAKKAGERRALGPQYAKQADLISTLADKANRGAVRAFLAAAQPAELTVYRASHDSIVMGLYTTRDAAREHCETVLRHEVGSTMQLCWVPDDGSDDAPEELCTGQDAYCTGYVVTPLTVAAAYDEDGDE